MKLLNHVRQVFPLEFIDQLKQRAEDTVNEIYQDYFSNKTFVDFQRQHLGHTSLTMKIATMRFATYDILNRLRTLLLPTIAELYGEDDILIHPIFYLRISEPGIHFSEKHHVAMLDSQPHYDRSFGLDAFSFWTALDRIDQESGGICSFSGDEILDHFPRALKNRYNYNTYIEVAPQLDRLLEKGLFAPVVEPGDVITFESHILHGATKPKSRRRISFDFRLIPVSRLKNVDEKTQKLFNEVNRNFDLCMVNNLLFFGDYKGAGLRLRKIAAETENPDLALLGDGLVIKEPIPELLNIGQQMAWQDEYKWIIQPAEQTAY